jgi:hypothetical protein
MAERSDWFEVLATIAGEAMPKQETFRYLDATEAMYEVVRQKIAHAGSGHVALRRGSQTVYERAGNRADGSPGAVVRATEPQHETLRYEAYHDGAWHTYVSQPRPKREFADRKSLVVKELL